MKIALFGDIHANLEALQSVLRDSRQQGCDSHACLGDIVGYAANPIECVQIVRDLGCPVVQGDHDEIAANENSLHHLHPLAQKSLFWTRQQLREEQRQWLRSLKRVDLVNGFTIVHATLDVPDTWGFVVSLDDAKASFSNQRTQLCFYGHTHVPRIFEKDHEIREVRGPDVILRSGAKYFINVGSVGQSRDGDWRAAYAIYDTQSQTISIRRLEYDIENTRRKIREAGM